MNNKRWIALPLEDCYDSMGRQTRKLSRDEQAVMDIHDGDVNSVRINDGEVVQAVWIDGGYNGGGWFQCDEDGEPFPTADSLDVVAVLV